MNSCNTIGMADYLDQDKYIKEFNPKAYLKMLGEDDFEVELQHLSHFYSRFQDNSLDILDYSGGPSLLYMTAAVQKASKIVFTDFLKQNREEVEKWLYNHPDAFDWTPAITNSLALEGKPANSDEVAKRTAMLREKITAVVHCDLKAENIVAKRYEGPYDVVNCIGVLDAVCATKDQFVDCVKKLSHLVKNGGYLLVTIDSSDSYFVADTKFVTPLQISKEDLDNTLKSAGFINISFESYYIWENIILAIAQKDSL